MVFSTAQTVYGLPGWAHVLFVLPVVIAALSVGLLVFAILAWMRRFWSLPGRIHFSLVALSGLAFVVWLVYWNLWIGHLY
jgi:hypothetical protein